MQNIISSDISRLFLSVEILKMKFCWNQFLISYVEDRILSVEIISISTNFCHGYNETDFFSYLNLEEGMSQ